MPTLWRASWGRPVAGLGTQDAFVPVRVQLRASAGRAGGVEYLHHGLLDLGNVHLIVYFGTEHTLPTTREMALVPGVTG
jgi:hypothetical protein